MASLEPPGPSEHSAGKEDWFKRSSSKWTSADRDAARRYCDDNWALIRGDIPDAVAKRPEVAAAREHVLGQWEYKGNSLRAFLDHCTLHLRTLMYVLLRERNGVVDEAALAAAHRRLSDWLNEDQLPHERLVVVAAFRDRESGRLGAPTYVWRFCRESLASVIAGYTPRGGSAWAYVKSSFERYVSRNLPGGPGDLPDGPPPVVAPPSTARSDRPPDAEPVVIPPGDDEEEECADRRAGEVRRVLRELKEREKKKRTHRGTLLRTCGGCRQLRALTMHRHELQRRERRALETAGSGEESELLSDKHDGALCASVAQRIKLTPGYVRVLIYHMRHRLRAEMQRYPEHVAFDSTQKRWRVHLNRFAMWDTPVRLACLPTDLARLPAPTVTVSQCARWSDPFELALQDLPMSRPTGFAFAAGSKPGPVAVASLRLNQVRLRAIAGGRHVDTWIPMEPLKQIDLDVKVSSAPTSALVVKGQRQPLPVTLNVRAGTHEAPIQLDLSGIDPGLAGVEFDSPVIAGGDSVDAIITVGARLVAEANGHRVEGALPMASRAPIHGALHTGAPRVTVPSQWNGTGPFVTAVVKTQAVGSRSEAVVTAEASGTTYSDALTLLPPEIVSLKLLDRHRRQVDTIRAGGAVAVEIEFNQPAVSDTEVTVSINHSAATLEAPVVVSASTTRAKGRIVVADQAQEMRARVEASANGTRKTSRLHIKPKDLRLSFVPPTIQAGTPAVGTLTCDPPVRVATKFKLRVEGEEAGGALQNSSRPAEPLVDLPREIEIPAGGSEAPFLVTAAVAVRRRVTIIAEGLGAEKSGSLGLAWPDREPEGAASDGA